MNRILIAALLMLSTVLSISGCAYHMGAGERQIPGGYRMVAVPVFKNATPEVGVEVYFTNAMVRELGRSRLAHVTDKGSSEVTIEGTVGPITYVPTNSTVISDTTDQRANGAVLNTEYRIFASATLRLRRNSDQKVLWEGTFSDERVYFAPRITLQELSSANALYNQSARMQNLQEMAQNIMGKAYDGLTENF